MFKHSLLPHLTKTCHTARPSRVLSLAHCMPHPCLLTWQALDSGPKAQTPGSRSMARTSDRLLTASPRPAVLMEAGDPAQVKPSPTPPLPGLKQKHVLLEASGTLIPRTNHSVQERSSDCLLCAGLSAKALPASSSLTLPPQERQELWSYPFHRGGNCGQSNLLQGHSSKCLCQGANGQLFRIRA